MRARERARELVNKQYELICKLVPVTDGESRSNRYKQVMPIAKQLAMLNVFEQIKLLERNFLRISGYTELHNELVDITKEIEKL